MCSGLSFSRIFGWPACTTSDQAKGLHNHIGGISGDPNPAAWPHLRTFPDSARLSPTLPASSPLALAFSTLSSPTLPDSPRLSPTLRTGPRLPGRCPAASGVFWSARPSNQKLFKGQLPFVVLLTCVSLDAARFELVHRPLTMFSKSLRFSKVLESLLKLEVQLGGSSRPSNDLV